MRNMRFGTTWTAALAALLGGACVWAEPAASVGMPWPRHTIDDSSRGADGVKLADVNGDGLVDITTGWEEGGVTRVTLNPGPERAALRWPGVTVGQTRNVEDAVFADLDGDGTLEVVSCCEGKTRCLLVHWRPGAGTELLAAGSWSQQAIPASVNGMAWMYAVPLQVDGRNGVDLVVGGKGKGAAVGWFEAPADPRGVASYAWHRMSPAGWVMSLILSDMDGDGDTDVLVTDRKGQRRATRWLENPGVGAGQRKAWKSRAVSSNVGEGGEVMFADLVDLDQDGKEDIVVSVKPATVVWYRRLDASGRRWQEHAIAYPGNTGNAKGIAAGDIDLDGRIDLVVSCEHATPPKSGVVWMSYRGDPTERVWEAHEISGPDGIKFDQVELLDLDGDSDLDVLTCEERHGGKRGGLGVVWYENPARQRAAGSE